MSQSGKAPTLSDWDPIATDSSASGEAIRGGAAIAMSRIGRQVLSLLITIVLARLLTPAEFGAVAVIAALIAVGRVLQDAGLSGATIQRARVSAQAVSTLFWINTALGLVLTLLLTALANPIADFFKHPELAALVRVASLTFLLNGLVAQHRALLQRSMRFVMTARIELGSAVVGGVSAVVMAVLGFGYWALVAQTLIADALAVLMLISTVRWSLTRPKLTAEAREMALFGGSMLGFNLVVTAANNLAVVLLGRGIGTGAAGIYTRAYALASLPQVLLQSTAGHVALPKLSRVQDDVAGFSALYYNGVQLLTLVSMPVALAFATFGEPIALVVYGSGWGEVSRLLEIFSVGLAVAPLLHSTGPVFLSRGEPHRMLRWGLFGACLIATGALIGVHWGIVGVATAWSATMLVLLLPCLWYAFRGTDLTIADLTRAVGGIYAAAACTLPLGFLLRRVVADLPMLAQVALGLSSTLIIYAALCYFLFGQKALIRVVVTRLTLRPGKGA